jgi:monoamine oxidase
MIVNRREFLHSTLALPALAALHAPSKPRVLVLGAGLAGLSAAAELDRAGFDVLILEARTRAGGRVYTLREPFSDGLYAEAGAARIQDSHAFTMRYVKEFNLALDPFFPAEGSAVMRIAGKRLLVPPRMPPDISQVPLAFTDEERKAGMRGSFGKYLFSHLGEIGDPTAADWPSKDLSRFERSIADYCEAQGASSGFLQMMQVGHDLDGMSALQLLRDTAVGMNTRVWYKIRGGNDQLPKAFAAALATKIQYGAPIVRIEQDSSSAGVVYLHAGAPTRLTADFLVCTIPLPVLRRIELAPAWSPLKRAAIDEVDNLAMARVYLQSRTRFWLDRGESGWGQTDDPIDVWDYTRDQPGTRGILGAYTSGRMARQITARDPAERGPFVLEMMERLHPGIREHYEGTASYSWITDPWVLGAAAEFKSGQLSKYYAALRQPEGRIHFAGEHTSPWNGWMNGGLESGLRVAQEIRRRAAL